MRTRISHTFKFEIRIKLGVFISFHSLKEEIFNLAPVLRVLSPWKAGFQAEISLQKCMTEESCLVHGSWGVCQRAYQLENG